MDEYTEDLAETICARLAEGVSLREICSASAMPDRSTVLRWRERHPDFRERFDAARMFGYLNLADEIMDVANDGRNDWMVRQDPKNPGWVLNGEHVQRSRLRIDTMKWVLSKMLPKVYGDSMALKHSDPDGGPLQVTITRFTDVPPAK
jgi:hypothetical protein